ncbi:MAG: SAM-dependent chlorinase/fluorinase, partial [Ginsengibacter sp.]
MALITLTSDIGRQDFLTGAVKGQLLQINPDFKIIDISHELSPFNYPQAAYVCRNAIKSFPLHTFHIILVNLFDQRPDHLLFIQHKGQYIGCADNGLITMILEETPEKIVALPLKPSEQKNTLYCANVFARAFRDILNGKTLEQVGDDSVSIEVKNPLRPLLGPKYIEGQIIFIDNFENVII